MESTTVSREKTARPGRVRGIIGLLVGVAGFYLFANGALGESAYLVSVDEALAASADAPRAVRVSGTVVPGSYAEGAGHTFTLRGGQREVQVRYEGPLPDVFEEGREVVVEGTLGEDWLEANELIAKCPDFYWKAAGTGMELAADPAPAPGRI